MVKLVLKLEDERKHTMRSFIRGFAKTLGFLTLCGAAFVGLIVVCAVYDPALDLFVGFVGVASDTIHDVQKAVKA